MTFSWRGKRGEWYVVLQVLLIVLVFLGPQTLPGLPQWPAPIRIVTTVLGTVLFTVGALILVAGGFRLGMPNITPLPYPRTEGRLITTGVYRIVRHPMYSGGILMSYGWALAVQGWLTLVYATALLIFADAKATREEKWLVQKYPEYPEYQRRTRKLIPFVR